MKQCLSIQWNEVFNIFVSVIVLRSSKHHFSITSQFQEFISTSWTCIVTIWFAWSENTSSNNLPKISETSNNQPKHIRFDLMYEVIEYKWKVEL